MAKKGAMPTYDTIDAYIASQKPEAQTLLASLRALVKEVVPEAIELAHYKVPSFKLVAENKEQHQLMVVAYAKAVSFYPHESCVNHFKSELEGFELGKGTVKFPFGKDLPIDLIKQMIAFRQKELLMELEAS